MVNYHSLCKLVVLHKNCIVSQNKLNYATEWESRECLSFCTYDSLKGTVKINTLQELKLFHPFHFL